MSQGKIYLIPVPLGEECMVEAMMPVTTIPILNSIQIFYVENAKTARRFLRKMGFTGSFDEVKIETIAVDNDPTFINEFYKALAEGFHIGILSEAGCPGIADPGSEMVRLAHAKKIQVVPLVGPSSILLALMASGLNGQQFAFRGYLPKEEKERIAKLRELERLAFQTHQTQLFIETPYRNDTLLESILKYCSDPLRLCIAANLMQPDEFILTQSIAEWKKQPFKIGKKPTLFLIGS